MNYVHFIGIDVSKEWFDVALHGAKPAKPERFPNSGEGFAVRVASDSMVPTVRLIFRIVFKNMRYDQLALDSGDEPDSRIHSVTRPRGGAGCHQDRMKHAVLLSRVCPGLPETQARISSI